MRRFRIFWNYQKIFINKKVSLTKFDFSCLDPASFQSTKLPTQHHPESSLYYILMGVRMIFCHGNHLRARGAHFLALKSNLQQIWSRQLRPLVPANYSGKLFFRFWRIDADFCNWLENVFRLLKRDPWQLKHITSHIERSETRTYCFPEVLGTSVGLSDR